MVNVYDIETYNDDSNVVVYCICMLVNNKMYTFYINNYDNIIIDSLKEIAMSCSLNKIELFIHNINFDGFVILHEIVKENILYDLFVRKNNIYYIDIYYMNKTIRFRCSYKIIPLSLKELGLLEKFEKTAFPYKFVNKETISYIGETPSEKYWENVEDFKKFKEKKIYNIKNETIKYCTNDVILTHKFLSNILPIINSEYNKILDKCYSASSISYKIFLKKYNEKKIEDKLLKTIDSYIRKSYFGGRCEVFGNPYKNEIIKYYDFSGMYAQCMKEKFHNGKAEFSVSSSVYKPGFHTIDYESNIEDFPVLPHHSSTKKLLFTNGNNSGTFWFEEIILFLEMGGKIKKYHHSYIYDNFEEVFESYVNKFSDIRKRGGYYKVFGKLMINSLYGSMALREDEEHVYITYSEEEFYDILETTNVNTFNKIQDKMFIIFIKKDYKSKKLFNQKDSLNSSRNISYSSAISSKARIKLYKAIIDVKKDGGRILYCDTDSIFASYPANNISNKTNSFEWIKFYKDGVFIAPKMYALLNYDNSLEMGEEIVIKGVNNKKTLNFNQLKDDFYNNNDIVIENQLSFRKSNFQLKQNYLNKNIKLSEYNKRIFFNNKKESRPIILNPDIYK